MLDLTRNNSVESVKTRKEVIVAAANNEDRNCFRSENNSGIIPSSTWKWYSPGRRATSPIQHNTLCVLRHSHATERARTLVSLNMLSLSDELKDKAHRKVPLAKIKYFGPHLNPLRLACDHGDGNHVWKLWAYWIWWNRAARQDRSLFQLWDVAALSGAGRSRSGSGADVSPYLIALHNLAYNSSHSRHRNRDPGRFGIGQLSPPKSRALRRFRCFTQHQPDHGQRRTNLERVHALPPV